LNKIGLTGNDTDNRKSIEELCRIFVEKGKQDPNWIINKLVTFLREYKDRYDRREISGSTIRNYVKVVKLLCEMNDIAIPWKKITRGLPKGRQWADDRTPSIDEIRKLCGYPDRRIKPLIYTMCSSGIRLGAWDYLRWQDVSPIIKDGKLIAAKLRVYSGEEDQYYAYCTPEAYNALKDWMDYRETSGEKITGKSWIMRDLWATLDPRINGSINIPRKKKSSGIKRLIENAWYSQGLRKPLEEGKTRHEFQAVHGFRKFYKTRCELAGMKPSMIEVSMGHSLGGVSDSYFRPREEEVLDEYLKAVDALSINDTQKLKVEVESLKADISELQDKNRRIEELESKQRQFELAFQALIDTGKLIPSAPTTTRNSISPLKT
jgi:hypothetical protein